MEIHSIETLILLLRVQSGQSSALRFSVDRLSALQAAFMNAMRDPDLIAFTREKKFDVGTTLSGNELKALVDETLANYTSGSRFGQNAPGGE
jgi:hypothetical protein